MSLEMNQVAAVVLAGGFGTRVAHLLPGIPKPMARVDGKPFLEWVVRYLARQGVKNVILSTGHLSHVVEEHFRANLIPGVTVRCFAETQPLGTGGGFLNAVQLSGDTPPAWLVLNGDSLVLSGLAPAVNQFNDPSVSGVVMGCVVPDATRYGSHHAIGPDNRLQGFAEKRPGRGAINAGIYLFHGTLPTRFSPKRPLSFEVDVFPQLIEDGALVKVVEVDAPFLDIGTPDSLKEAEDFVQQNRSQFLE